MERKNWAEHFAYQPFFLAGKKVGYKETLYTITQHSRYKMNKKVNRKGNSVYSLEQNEE